MDFVTVCGEIVKAMNIQQMISPYLKYFFFKVIGIGPCSMDKGNYKKNKSGSSHHDDPLGWVLLDPEELLVVVR